MKKYSLILIVTSFFINNSCSSGNEKKIVLDTKPPVTAKDAKNAFNLLEQANRERRYNNNNTKAVRGYISLIEKEPNFIPAYMDFFRWVFDEEVQMLFLLNLDITLIIMFFLTANKEIKD